MSETTCYQEQSKISKSTDEKLRLSQTDYLTLAFILIGLGLVRLLGVFTLRFTDTTEARYAEIARKMIETQDWITPQFDYGIPFWGKPPLHTWLSAAGMELFGINGFGARVLIFACAIALLFLPFRWVRQEMGSSLKISMNGKGNCYDNSAVETFFKTIKTELIWRRSWQMSKKAESAIFQHINGFYNLRRRHSALSWESPVTCERKVA